MEAVTAFFQRFPELAIFLTLGVGYWVGSIKLGNFSLGSVTGTLLVGVAVGWQLAAELGHPNDTEGD